MDGSLVKSRHALLMTEEACWGMQVTRQGSHPVLTHPTCTALMSQVSGRRLPFQIQDHRVIPTHSTVTVPVGSTVVFWPKNAATTRAVNTGSVGLLGPDGENGRVFGDMANQMGTWAEPFRSVGSYDFAVILQPNPFNGTIPATWVIHVVSAS